MKSMLIGLVAVVIGVGGGAFVSGSKVKDQMVQAHADSLAAAEAAHTAEAVHAASRSTGSEGVPVELSQNTPPAGSDDGHTETGLPASAASLPVGTTAGPTSTPSAEAPVQTEPAVDSAALAAEQAAEQAAAEREAEEAAAAVAMAEGAQKLSKIFGAMKAPDAAAVLQQMTDDEVKVILLQMSDRLAAAILGEFDPDRAAELTRVVLLSRGGGA